MALEGYTKAYGQQHKTPVGMMCWQGRIERAKELIAAASGDDKVKKQKAMASMITLAEKDFIEGERLHADYVDLCRSVGVTPKDVNPDCQCDFCQRIINGAELLFAVEA